MFLLDALTFEFWIEDSSSNKKQTQAEKETLSLLEHNLKCEINVYIPKNRLANHVLMQTSFTKYNTKYKSLNV